VLQTYTRERMLEMLSRDNDFTDAKLSSTFAYTLSFNVDMYWSCKGNKFICRKLLGKGIAIELLLARTNDGKYFIIKVETLVI
ncbi:hypothetical protein M8C21_006369, partial [Ambrosia artemisiifolia]